MVLILGDCNARIHARLQGEDDSIGPHVYGLGAERLAELWREKKANEKSNREMLVERCREEGYRVMNTWYKKPDAGKVTHVSACVTQLPKQGEPWDPTVFGEIDLCLVQNKWKGAIKDVEADTGAGLNTDHFPLIVKPHQTPGAKYRRR